MAELSCSQAPPEPPLARQLPARRNALRDCFYHWFRELETLGEETTFRLGHVSGQGAQPVWTTLPHHTFDGLGGLYHVLEERFDQRIELPVLPGPYPGP